MWLNATFLFAGLVSFKMALGTWAIMVAWLGAPHRATYHSGLEQAATSPSQVIGADRSSNNQFFIIQ
jgi:hypothetical protein